MNASPGTELTVQSAYDEYNQIQSGKAAASEESSSEESTSDSGQQGSVFDSVQEFFKDYLADNRPPLLTFNDSERMLYWKM